VELKEDVLEQVVDDYLQSKGYFTRHNVKFGPSKRRADYDTKADCVDSDIDIVGVNPRLRGTDRVWAVSCKSWQGGFRIGYVLTGLKENKIHSGREAWRGFRELWVRKWSKAFCDKILLLTGSRRFTYVTAVTRMSGVKAEWEGYPRFRRNLDGNPVRLVTLQEMVDDMLPRITRTPSGSELGRTLQLLKSAGVLNVNNP
jgi:hypothetical protein